MSESPEISILSKLDELEMVMNDLNNEAKTRIEDLRNLEILAKKFEMREAAEILNRQIKEIDEIVEEIDDNISREINEIRIKEQIELKIKTVSSDTEDLKKAYAKISNDLKEIIRERNKIKIKNK
ncbi:MAG: hypothetical protein QG646_2839 [Euryarchaeota archaeon]|nr:hypothetical protein [Euryarchaeota archaeon]